MYGNTLVLLFWGREEGDGRLPRALVSYFLLEGSVLCFYFLSSLPLDRTKKKKAMLMTVVGAFLSLSGDLLGGSSDAVTIDWVQKKKQKKKGKVERWGAEREGKQKISTHLCVRVCVKKIYLLCGEPGEETKKKIQIGTWLGFVPGIWVCIQPSVLLHVYGPDSARHWQNHHICS